MTTGDEPFDTLVACLRAQGLDAAAESLEGVLTGVWTTSSEFLGEVGLELVRIRKAYGRAFSSDTKRAFGLCWKRCGRPISWGGFKWFIR
jgi:hypothetical protein